ncbi:hypothetical protein N7603_01205 [Acholeplasma vituli]|uniref:Atrophied bacterial Ig domain-containing protein n=1 Tax=Paracholeplasma vituli TaxID=69473 RepID=A0ABT2PU45_9MOLU|nr:immunoglobulin-like domain-containing protein [Paracholeplasma vituli]MCU0104268.1 hypothetical protein [Paracholeplasma vituli]
MKQFRIAKSFFALVLMVVAVFGLAACVQKSDQAFVDEAFDSLNVTFQSGDSATSVTKNLTLPGTVGDVKVTWKSSQANIISITGVVTRGNSDQTVTLTATLSYGEAKKDKTFEVKVIAALDTVAPAFMNTINGKLAAAEHLETVEIDLMEGIVARDNRDGYDVVITYDDSAYDKDAAGEYVIVYTAEDKSGNKTNTERIIRVIDALDVTVDAAVIGNKWVPYIYNDDNAFKNNGTYGAAFRTQDILHVMSKEFFVAQVAEHGSEYPTNNNLPLLPYGSLIVTDKDFNIIHARFQTGVYLQMDVVDGVTTTTHTTLNWNREGVAGGDLFYEVADLIPADGYIMFLSAVAPQSARIFLVSNLFYTGYTGGAVTKDFQDIFELTDIELDLVEDFRVLIKMPDPINTPEIELNRHTLSWDAIPGALNYQLFVDGVAFGDPITATSVDLSKLALELSTNDGYEITVVANTQDQFKYSSSQPSNVITYKKVEIQNLSAPVIAADTENVELLKWEAVEGTDFYEIYVQVTATVNVLVGTSKTNSFDTSVVRERFNGYNGYIVKGIGLATHTDSSFSNKVFINQVTTTQITIGNVKTTAMVMTAEAYFLKRNGGFNNTYESYVFVITGTYEYTGAMTEATSVIALLDSQGKVKFVRNILATATHAATYTPEKGWFHDPGYASQTAQLANIREYLAAGDVMIIGKQLGSTLQVQVGENAPVVGNAREIAAYAFIVEWATFPTAASGTAGWRGDMSTFKDAKTITVTIGTPAIK